MADSVFKSAQREKEISFQGFNLSWGKVINKDKRAEKSEAIRLRCWITFEKKLSLFLLRLYRQNDNEWSFLHLLLVDYRKFNVANYGDYLRSFALTIIITNWSTCSKFTGSLQICTVKGLQHLLDR